MGGQLLDDGRGVVQDHVEHTGLTWRGQHLPVQLQGLVALAVAGYEGHALGVVPVRQGDAAVGRATGGGGNPRHHLEVDVVLYQEFGFFTATAEDVRVAAFQAHNPALLQDRKSVV